MTLHLLPEADGEAIVLWYEDRCLGLGDEFLSDLDAVFTAIRSNANSLPRLEGYSGPLDIRRQLLKSCQCCVPQGLSFVFRPERPPHASPGQSEAATPRSVALG